LMYFCSLFVQPSQVYRSFNGLNKKMVVADFGGKLPDVVRGDNKLRLVVEILSESYS